MSAANRMSSLRKQLPLPVRVAYGWGRRHLGASSSWRNGHFTAVFDRIQESQWWSRSELEALQLENLQGLVAHVYENVPYYHDKFQDLGLRPSDFNRLEDLTKLPLLTKQEVRQNAERLVARNADRSCLFLNTTGGSTDVPLSVYQNRITRDPYEDAFRLRQWLWGGYHFGDRFANLQGNLIAPRGGTDERPWWDYCTDENSLVLSVRHMSEDGMHRFVGKLRSFRPRFVCGYPSSLEVMARFLMRNGIDDVHPKAAFCESETLYPQQRSLIEAHFHCPLYSAYGMTERVVDAVECEQHQGYHVSMEYGILELVDKDGQPVTRPGEVARVVGTGFDNNCMPLIRYATDDLAERADGECGCGRQLALIGDFRGRVREFVVLRSGQLVPLPVLFAGHGSVWGKLRELHFIQEKPGELAIQVAAAPGVSDEEVVEGLHTVLAERLGDEVRATITFVDSVPRTQRGKMGLLDQRLPIGLEDLAGGGR
ncbi:MAG: phenylacetate--CoA ligase family protein [Anaerolineae bacterium]